MPHPPTADLDALIRALDGIDLIVVGGAAAVIHGAPITTQDLDVVPAQDPDNLARLLAALQRLESRFRPVLPGRDLPPTQGGDRPRPRPPGRPDPRGDPRRPLASGYEVESTPMRPPSRSAAGISGDGSPVDTSHSWCAARVTPMWSRWRAHAASG